MYLKYQLFIIEYHEEYHELATATIEMQHVRASEFWCLACCVVRNEA